MHEFALLEDTQFTRSKDRLATYFHGKATHIICRHPEHIEATLQEIDARRSAGQHLVGFISYACAYPLFKIPYPFKEKLAPLIHFVHFDKVSELSPAEAGKLLIELTPPTAHETFVYNSELGINFQEYQQAIQTIKQHIKQGDTYQINLTDRYTFQLQGHALALYLQLKIQQPVAYSAVLHFQDYQILSLSPELFFKKNHDTLITQPMKGTMPRSENTERDQANQQFLTQDPKSLSENLIIVDLLRNDLNQIAEPGSVHAKELFAVKSLKTVHQMVSTLEATIHPQCPFQDIIQALFPCGSITGAPKKRTLELISQLERNPRGLYTGAIGHIKPNNDMCFNVSIRTVWLEQQKGQMGVGGGIVNDSEALSEYQEMKLKGRFLTDMPLPFQLIETLYYRPTYGIRHIESHLARLQNSASVLGFKIDIKDIHQQLLQAIALHTDHPTYKIRLMAYKDGSINMSLQPIHETALCTPLTLALEYKTTMDACNILLQHKTTAASVRGVYQNIMSRHKSKQPYDVLVRNKEHALTEGTKTNVFVVKDGTWYTPAQNSGVLPGVMRQQLIQKKQVRTDQRLSFEDLHKADEIWLSNALIGVQRATLI